MALHMVNRRLLTGCKRCRAIISAWTRNTANSSCRAPLRRCLLTGSGLLAECKSKKKIDLEVPNPDKLTQEYLLKSSSAQTADSVTAILSQTARALIDAEQEYREMVKVLIQMTEHHLNMLGSTEEDRIWDMILEIRNRVDKFNHRRKEMELLFSCVQKLVDSTAEVAFLTGADFTSTSLGERMHNAQRHVEGAKAKSLLIEEDLRKVQAESVRKVSEQSEKQKKRRAAEDGDKTEDASEGKDRVMTIEP